MLLVLHVFYVLENAFDLNHNLFRKIGFLSKCQFQWWYSFNFYARELVIEIYVALRTDESTSYIADFQGNPKQEVKTSPVIQFAFRPPLQKTTISQINCLICHTSISLIIILLSSARSIVPFFTNRPHFNRNILWGFGRKPILNHL